MLDRLAPWELEGIVSDGLDNGANQRWLAQCLSEPSPKIRSHVVQGGLVLGDPAGHDALFIDAGAAIAEVPCVAEIVRARVAHIHTLKAAPGYDISHSEPNWADRIFISVPERTDRVGALRLAESVIHEAMHLHLTRFERDTPLVRNGTGQVFSPWRQTFRPHGGVLHGLFVFCCLRDYFKRLPPDRRPFALDHVRQRLEEIDAEVAQVDIETLKAGLSDAGQALVGRLLESSSLR